MFIKDSLLISIIDWISLKKVLIMFSFNVCCEIAVSLMLIQQGADHWYILLQRVYDCQFCTPLPFFVWCLVGNSMQEESDDTGNIIASIYNILELHIRRVWRYQRGNQNL